MSGLLTPPPPPPEERLCLTCEGEPVDDELQLLLQCDKYSGDRNNLFVKLINLCPNFEHLDSNSKSLYMLSAKVPPGGWMDESSL